MPNVILNAAAARHGLVAGTVIDVKPNVAKDWCNGWELKNPDKPSEGFLNAPIARYESPADDPDEKQAAKAPAKPAGK